MNARGLPLESARLMHEDLVVPVLIYGSETMVWRRKVLGLGSYGWIIFRCLLGIRRIDKMPNARVRELCEVKKRRNERVDECSLPV